MRVLHLSQSHSGGGAAIAAYRLHRGLKSIGAESLMVVDRLAAGPSSDADIRSLEPERTLPMRVERRIGGTLRARSHRRALSRRSPLLELFSDGRSPGRDLFAEGLPSADIHQLHWVEGFLDYKRYFRALPDGVPMVWTLHDMAPFTGGCHYTMGCTRFAEHCGSCALLGSGAKTDPSLHVLARKKAALASRDLSRTCVVAPSRWLAAEAKRSAVLGRFRVEVIPNGLDCDTFCPRDKGLARDVFGLPRDKPVILFVADSLASPRKGVDLLARALSRLGTDVVLAALGRGRAEGILPETTHYLGRIENPRLMSFAYSVADLFVLPTRADNLPNVLVEAMACGVPTVSFRVGGVPDVVDHGATGLLAEPEDPDDLGRQITALLDDTQLRARFGHAARRRACERYSDGVVAERYRALYEELLEAT